MEIKNIVTNEKGCAVEIPGTNKIKIYIGNPNGENDKVITKKEFEKDYIILKELEKGEL